MSFDYLERALAEIRAERFRQDVKWGADREIDSVLENTTPDSLPEFYGVPTEAIAKAACDASFADGTGTWADILIEELTEAISAPNDQERRKELIQLAAVCVANIENIDRRGGRWAVGDAITTRCAQCKQPFAPPVGLFDTNDVQCPHCKAAGREPCYAAEPMDVESPKEPT